MYFQYSVNTSQSVVNFDLSTDKMIVLLLKFSWFMHISLPLWSSRIWNFKSWFIIKIIEEAYWIKFVLLLKFHYQHIFVKFMIYFAISKKKYKKVYNKKNSKISKKFSIIITEYLLVGRVRRHSPSPCSSDRDCTTHHCHSSSEKPYCDHTRGHCECARTEQVLSHSKPLGISISVCLFLFCILFCKFSSSFFHYLY